MAMRAPKMTKTERTNKKCAFCEGEKKPSYIDSSNLKRYVSDRARIQPKMRTGTCSKHQRQLTKHIKYARHLALLPFVNKV